MLTALKTRLASLTPTQRKALLLFLAGCVGAIGALTGIPLDAVMSVLTPLLGP